MGFGFLFFACFLTYFGAISPVGTFTYLIGAAFMLLALYKLSTLNKVFVVSAVGSFVLLIASFALVIMFVFNYENNSIYKVLSIVQSYMASALLFIIHIAIYSIAKEVELRKLQGWCIVNCFFIVTYVVCDVVSIVAGEVAFSRLGLIGVIIQVLYSAFTLIILFNCYAKICYEDDVNMKNDKTGVAAFDVLNKAFDKVANKNKHNRGGK